MVYRFSRVVISIVVFMLVMITQLHAAWGPGTRLVTTPDKWENGQSFALDSNQKVHTAFVSWNDNSSKIPYYMNNVSGSWSAPAAIPIPGYWLYERQTAMAISSDNTIHLVITAKNPSNGQGVIYLTKTPFGSWSAPQALTDYANQFCYVNALAILPDNSLYLVYQDTKTGQEGVYGKFKPAGGSWGAQEIIAQSASFPQGWARAIGEDLYVTYTLNNSGCFYRARKGNAYTGYTWSNFIQLASYGQNGSWCTISKSPITGELAATFGYNSGGSGSLDFNIFSRFSTDNGQTWSAPVQVSPWTSLDRGASANYDRAGNYHVAWYGRTTDGGQDDVLYKKRQANGTWDASITNITNSIGRTGLWVESIRPWGQTLYLMTADCWNDTGVPGWEDPWFYMFTPPAAPPALPAPSPFTVLAGEERAFLNWTNPSGSSFSSTVVRMSTTGFPSGPFDGDYVTEQYASPGTLDSKIMIPLTAGQTHYFSAFAIDQWGNSSVAAQGSCVPYPDVTAPVNVINFTGTADSANNITLSWTNPSDIDYKGVVIRMSTSGFPTNYMNGTLVVNKTGAPGEMQTHIVTGLAPATTYYFAAFAYDAKPNYASGSQAMVSTFDPAIGFIKRQPDGTAVSVYNKVVTSLLTTAFYIQEENRAAGVRVNTTPTGLALGDRVNVTGTMGTLMSGSSVRMERQINSPTFTKVFSGMDAVPLAMSNRTVGGKEDGLIPGVKDGIGANNMGLLVKVYGKVTAVAGSYIWVDDGANIEDYLSRYGVMVWLPAGAPAISVGNMVSAVGIVEGSVPVSFTTNRRSVRPRVAADVQVLSP